LIRLKGICSLDAYVLTPTIPEATIHNTSNKIRLADIADAGDDEFVFNLTKRDFIEVDLLSVDIQLAYTDPEGMSDFITLESIDPSTIPVSISITASEAAALFGKTAAELMPGDEFTVKFMFVTSTKSFSN